jgi:hypothetical protein
MVLLLPVTLLLVAGVRSDLAGLAGIKTITGTSLATNADHAGTGRPPGVTATLFAVNETLLWAYNVSASCAASPTCAAQTTFLWTTGGKEGASRFIYDNVILRCESCD